jgi:hypothetical protein
MTKKAGMVSVDSRELEAFSRRIPAAQAGARKQLGADVAGGGQLLRRQARQNAAFSKRIPRTIQLRDDKTGRIAGRSATAGVALTVGGPSAPHARVLEPASGKGTFAHPVYGRKTMSRKKWTWVKQRTRPYAQPALEQLRSRIISNVSDGQLASLKKSLGA